MKSISLTIVTSQLFVFGLYAGDTEKASTDQPTAQMPEEKVSTPSSVDKVIETIAEAAIQNREYGKDIGDR